MRTMEHAACWPAVADAPPKDCKVFPPAAIVTAPAPDWIIMTLYPAAMSVAGRVIVIAVAEVELIMVPASTAARVKLAALSTIVACSGLIVPAICSLDVGEVVPMPRLPLADICI